MKNIIMIVLCIISIAFLIYVAVSDSIRTSAYTAILLGCFLSVIDAFIDYKDKNNY